MASKSILVTGDFIVDHHIYEGRRHHYGERVEEGVKLCRQLGGAALIHDILTHLLKQTTKAVENQTAGAAWESRIAIANAPFPDDPGRIDTADEAYAFWRPFPARAPREKQVWRVSEAMGFGAEDRTAPRRQWTAAEDLPPTPDIVVVSEGGMGFRESPGSWADDKLAAARWIVLKTTAPLAAGSLWRRLVTRDREKLIVIVAARELRKSPARVSAGLSWEQSVQDVLREVAPGGAFGALRACRHLIVVFESEGGLWLDLAGAAPDVRFVYDPSVIEGDHARAIDGEAYGFQS
jgi:hypothetical protein